MNQAQDTPDGLFSLSLSYQAELVKFSAKLELPQLFDTLEIYVWKTFRREQYVRKRRVIINH